MRRQMLLFKSQSYRLRMHSLSSYLLQLIKSAASSIPAVCGQRTCGKRDAELGSVYFRVFRFVQLDLQKRYGVHSQTCIQNICHQDNPGALFAAKRFYGAKPKPPARISSNLFLSSACPYTIYFLRHAGSGSSIKQRCYVLVFRVLWTCANGLRLTTWAYSALGGGELSAVEGCR